MEHKLESNAPIEEKPGFMKKHGQKLIALFFWMILIAAY